MSNKLLNMLGLIRRAGGITAGFDAAVETARNGKGFIMLVASDVSEKTLKNIAFECKKYNTPLHKMCCTMSEVSHSLGLYKDVGIVSITNRSFEAKIKQLIEEEEVAHDE